MSPQPDFAAARRAMIDSQLRPQGVTDAAVLAAMASVPRERFVPEAVRPLAYSDRPLDLGDGKALMAPAVSTARKQEKIALAMGEQQKQAMAQLKALSEKMRENADYVGGKFAEEARKIHFGETEARGIYGEATPDEARGLIEDGVEFLPIPVFPDDHN